MRKTVMEQRLGWLMTSGWTQHPKKMAMVSPDGDVTVTAYHLANWNEADWASWCKGKFDE